MKHVMLFIAAAVISLTSCEQLEPTGNSNIATCEVVDCGKDAVVTVEASNGGTQISYRTWVELKGQTRADFESKISVVLTNSFSNLKKEFLVTNWNLGEAKAQLAYGSYGTKADGCIKITDSVKVYTVINNLVKIEYPLKYQVPLYDDGHVRVIMPHYGYDKSIVNNGFSVEKISSVERNGKAYARRLLRHSITVKVNGESYQPTAEIVLFRQIEKKDGNYILNSDLVQKSILPLNSSDDRCGFVARAKVSSEYSNGNKLTETFSEAIYATGENVRVSNALQVKKRSELQLKKATLVTEVKPVQNNAGTTQYMYKSLHTDVLQLDFGLFVAEVPFKYETCLFDNGVITEPLTESLMFDEKTVKVKKITWTTVDADSGLNNCEISIAMNLNGKEVLGNVGCFVTVK